MADAPGDQDDHLAVNRSLWDERVAHHRSSAFYDTDGVIAGTHDPLRPFEIEEVGDVDGRQLLHLQCHFGLDTIAWARRGAVATGLDFSGEAIAAAAEVAAAAGVVARFVQADVYDAPVALGGETFDIVYTGLGALNWLPDIGRWATTVAALLRPGGILYLAEFHPFVHVFADEDRTVTYGYFDPGPLRWADAGTYTDVADGAALDHDESIEWQHTIADVLEAVIAAGLTVESFREHDHTLFPRWPDLVPGPGGRYDLPDGTPSLPLMYSLRARLRA